MGLEERRLAPERILVALLGEEPRLPAEAGVAPGTRELFGERELPRRGRDPALTVRGRRRLGRDRPVPCWRGAFPWDRDRRALGGERGERFPAGELEHRTGGSGRRLRRGSRRTTHGHGIRHGKQSCRRPRGTRHSSHFDLHRAPRRPTAQASTAPGRSVPAAGASACCTPRAAVSGGRVSLGRTRRRVQPVAQLRRSRHHTGARNARQPATEAKPGAGVMGFPLSLDIRGCSVAAARRSGPGQPVSASPRASV